jgi:hypothetical protein
MSNKQVLWCKEGTHDKVWGIIELQQPQSYYDNGKYVTFWGRRGAKLQTKVWEGRSDVADELTRKKKNKGYDEIDQRFLDEVYPEFQVDLEKTELWAKLKL